MSVGNTLSVLARAPRIGLLSLCVVLVTVAAAGQAAGAAPATLGPPDVSGYCQHVGFSGASFTPPPNQSWQCNHADGSTSPVDMQAACEFSFSQRPVSAKQLTPGVLYTWQCLQTSASGTEAAPTAAQLKASLLRALRPTGRAARIGTLRSSGSYPLRFGALTAGSIRVSWSYQPKPTGQGARPKPVTVAAGRATISRAGSTSVRIALTAAGRRLLKHARRLKITARGSFIAVGRPAVLATQAVTLAR
jgi:hypothetical protein